VRLNKDILPIVGIVAFSGCSVNAVANLFFATAKNDTILFWPAAVLVELCTAWLVWSIVETTRKITKSNISKQDRRFHSIVLLTFVLLAIPSLSISVISNVLEFGGNILLGFLFPVLSVACAVGAGLPVTVRRYEHQQQEEVQVAQAARKKAQAERKRQQELVKRMARLGKAQATLMQLSVNPAQSQASIAQALSISRQAVGQHLERLEQAGAIRRNGDGNIEVLWEVNI